MDLNITATVNAAWKRELLLLAGNEKGYDNKPSNKKRNRPEEEQKEAEGLLRRK